MIAPNKATRRRGATHLPPPPDPYAQSARRALIPHGEATQALQAELLAIPEFRALAERIAKDRSR